MQATSAEVTERSREGRFPAVSRHRTGGSVVYRRRERRIELRGQFELREEDPEVSAALFQGDDPGVPELPEEVGHGVAVPLPLPRERGDGDLEGDLVFGASGPQVEGLLLQQVAEGVVPGVPFAVSVAEDIRQRLGQRMGVWRAL